MLNWIEFRRQLQGACILISVETGVTCFISTYPEQPLPGDRAAITVGADTVIYDGKTEIPVGACVIDFDLYDLRATSERIDVFAILHDEVVNKFYKENPEYAAWKMKQE